MTLRLCMLRRINDTVGCIKKSNAIYSLWSYNLSLYDVNMVNDTLALHRLRL